MNILPHKSWHVRTKKNIARVRKDEKLAAEQEKERLSRLQLADQEAKINLLRNRSNSKKHEEDNSNQHVNFFNEVESGKYASAAENQERVNEKKEEQEKYEKSIGYLTYLGQDTNEILGKKEWYLQDRKNEKEVLDNDGHKIEVNLKSKLANDPLMLIRKYTSSSSSEIPKPKPEIKKESLTSTKYESILPFKSRDEHKHKKRKKRSSSDDTELSRKSKKKHSKKKKRKKEKKSRKISSASSESSSEDEELRELKRQKLEILRKERLEREKVEREKADRLLAKIRGENVDKEKPTSSTITSTSMRQKYNSQFNPEFARQNQNEN